MARKTNKAMLGVIFLVIVLFLGFLAMSISTLKSIKKSDFVSAFQRKPIGVIEVTGVIMQSKKTIELLLEAEKDKTIKAIIVRVDSPGGAVGPTQEIYEEIRRIDKDVKPVYASFGGIAASGGYYIGAATRKIYANAGSLTGSIGVIMQFMNLEKLYEFLKLDPNTIKAGRYKDIGSPNRQMSPEERQIMQSMIDGVHTQFIEDIAKARKDKIKGSLRDHAQGQIFSGQMAMELGLVDSLKGLYAAGREIMKENQIEGEFGIKYFKEKKPFRVVDLLEDVESKMKGKLMESYPVLMFLAQ